MGKSIGRFVRFVREQVLFIPEICLVRDTPDRSARAKIVFPGWSRGELFRGVASVRRKACLLRRRGKKEKRRKRKKKHE